MECLYAHNMMSGGVAGILLHWLQSYKVLG